MPVSDLNMEWLVPLLLKKPWGVFDELMSSSLFSPSTKQINSYEYQVTEMFEGNLRLLSISALIWGTRGIVINDLDFFTFDFTTKSLLRSCWYLPLWILTYQWLFANFFSRESFYELRIIFYILIIIALNIIIILPLILWLGLIFFRCSLSFIIKFATKHLLLLQHGIVSLSIGMDLERKYNSHWNNFGDQMESYQKGTPFQWVFTQRFHV